MVGVSLFSADAVVLVFSLADQDSFEELVRLRELVRQAKGETKDQPPAIFCLSCGREPFEECKHTVQAKVYRRIPYIVHFPSSTGTVLRRNVA